MNAAGTLAGSSGRGANASSLWVSASFAIPGALVWAVGVLLLRFAIPAAVLVGIALPYAFAYGVVELLRLPIQAPESHWQVPSSWISGRGHAARAAVWGGILGPGIVTRNPFAGMWLFPILAAAAGPPATAFIVGGVCGFLHGTARAVGVLRHVRRPDPRG